MSPRVALVHDFLMQYGGAERVLECFHAMYPEAPVYTLLADKSLLPAAYAGWDIRPVSALQGAPWLRRRYKAFFPFYPRAIEQINLSGYDLIVSSSYAYAHGVPVPEGACHISYCHTPMRFAWFQEAEYRQNVPAVAAPVYDLAIRSLREWDREASRRPHRYVANGAHTARRIADVYGREATVVHPPCTLDTRDRGAAGAGDYYLIVARLVYPYKRIDIAMEAAKRLGRKLKIVGEGADRETFERLADHHVEFLGRIDDAALNQVYAGCKALLMPWDEDFGIAPIEANAFGKPVLTYRQSGATESQIEGHTALFFDELTPESLAGAMLASEARPWDAAAIRRSAARFTPDEFCARMTAVIQENMAAPGWAAQAA